MVRKQRRFTDLFANKSRRLGLSVEQLEPRVLMTSNPGGFAMHFLASGEEKGTRTISRSGLGLARSAWGA